MRLPNAVPVATFPRVATLALIIFNLTACGETATLPGSAGFGPTPELPPPNTTVIPTVHVATAIGWTGGGLPIAADGLSVKAYATGLDHPRWVYTLPNGDVLVAESNAPPKP